MISFFKKIRQTKVMPILWEAYCKIVFSSIHTINRIIVNKLEIFWAWLLNKKSWNIITPIFFFKWLGKHLHIFHNFLNNNIHQLNLELHSRIWSMVTFLCFPYFLFIRSKMFFSNGFEVFLLNLKHKNYTYFL